MGCLAFLAAIFVVTAVDDPAVFIVAVPDLGSKPPTALTAFYLAGENAHAAVSAAVLLTPCNLVLHHLEGGGVYDGRMALFHEVARHLPGVLHRLLGEEIRREGLLDAGTARILLVGENSVDGGDVPFALARDRQDTTPCQFLGDGARGQPLDEQSEDKPHGLGLLLIDGKIAVLPLVVAEETGVAYGELAVGELFSEAPSHIL